MAINTLLDKYDIYYRNAAGTELGLMLARYSTGDRKGVKIWRRDDERALPDSYAPGDISYANLSPDIQKVISHRYMHGGLGALEFEVEDEAVFQILRYLRSKNIDLRCKGKAYLGPKVQSITTPDVSDGESTETLRPNGAGSLTQIQYQHPDSGAHWEKVDEASPDDNGTYVMQGLTGYAERSDLYALPAHSGSGAISKVTFYFRIYRNFEADYGKGKCYFKTHGTVYSGTWRAPPHDGSYHTYSQDYTVNPYTGSAWTWDEIDALQAGVTLYSKGEGDHDYYDEVRCTQVYVIVSYSSEDYTKAPLAVFNGKLYLGRGKKLCRLNVDTNTFDEVTGSPPPFANPITDLAAVGDYLYIALGAPNKYYYMDASETFTESTLTNGEADKFCKVGTSLWQLKLPNKTRLSNNPTNTGSWGSQYKAGEDAYKVNDMLNHKGVLYCMKEDGPYYFSGGAYHQAFPALATITHTKAGKNSDVFRDGLYFRMGQQQEWEIANNVLSEITPSLFAPTIPEYNCPCVARAHDESWLYTIMKREAGDLAVLAGRWEYIAGRTRWIWHEIATIDQTDVDTALVCSVEGRPFLYLGSTDGTEDVYKVYLPTTNDATIDSSYKFNTSGQLWTPRYMSLLFAVNKRWQELFARSENLSDTKYINAYYSIDDGATFTLLKKLDTSPEQTEAFTDVEATMMNLRFDFVSDSDTVVPVLKYHNLKALTMMDAVARFRHTIRCADALRLKGNHAASPQYTSAAIRTFIDGIRDQVCTLGDRWGTEHTVRVRVTREEEVFDEETKNPELLYSLEAVKL